MTLRFTPRARNDLRDMLEYIAKENPAAGIRNAKVPELRSRLVAPYPYRIHYRVEDADVWIIHIRHSARRPWNKEI